MVDAAHDTADERRREFVPHGYEMLGGDCARGGISLELCSLADSSGA